jgi:dolichol-phosphate mannosyltransferase
MRFKKKLLSIVVPMFNEEESVVETIKRLLRVQENLFREINVELLFIDDGCTDKTFTHLRFFAEQNPSIKIISLSRNFGHQIAITAGIDLASGDYVAVIDGDLQDPPELIPDMLKLAMTDFDIVYGKRRSRAGETFFKKLTALAFYKFLKYMCEVDIPANTGDFRLISRRVVNVLKQMRERHRFIRGMIPWIGFKSVPIEYDRNERFSGETKYSLKKMIDLAVDAILSFSSKPLQIAIRLGLYTICAGLAGSGVMLYLKIFTNIAVPGLTAILLTIVFFGGIQIFLIGCIGQYIAKVFEENKGRPLYVVAETINI